MEPPKPSPQEANKLKAATELGMISELRNSAAFQWFSDEFLRKPYVAAAKAFLDPGTDDLKIAQARFLASYDVNTALLRREIAMRELANPKDSELPRLRASLKVLA